MNAAVEAPMTGAAKAHVPSTLAAHHRRWRRWLGVEPAEADLLRAAPRVAPVAGALLAAGVLAAVAGALVLRPELERRLALQGEAQRLEARLDRLGFKPESDASRHANRREVLEEGRELAAELRRPWHELFDQLEAAAQAEGGAVHIVQLTVEPRFDTIQLVAEARDLGRLVHFSQRLSGGAPVRSLNLTHYEWRDALGGHVLSASMQGDLVLAAPGAAAPATLSLAAAPER